ncbi:MAG: ATP-binding cassette domain-containing protein [Hydrogenophaga sp.]|nr:ATP-binding cassette domain-containing protein [Hydrogenophaga sp.]
MTSNSLNSPSSEASVLQARDITLRFGGVTALAEVAIDVRDNELLAIIGPNGAGKSSLMNVLSGF